MHTNISQLSKFYSKDILITSYNLHIEIPDYMFLSGFLPIAVLNSTYRTHPPETRCLKIPHGLLEGTV
jgi:hypothetical protein